MKASIEILLIHHKYGTNAYACDSECTTWLILSNWVSHWWDLEMRGQDMPNSINGAVSQYFESSHESYEILFAESLYTKQNVARRMKHEMGD